MKKLALIVLTMSFSTFAFSQTPMEPTSGAGVAPPNGSATTFSCVSQSGLGMMSESQKAGFTTQVTDSKNNIYMCNVPVTSK